MATTPSQPGPDAPRPRSWGGGSSLLCLVLSKLETTPCILPAAQDIHLIREPPLRFWPCLIFGLQFPNSLSSLTHPRVFTSSQRSRRPGRVGRHLLANSLPGCPVSMKPISGWILSAIFLGSAPNCYQQLEATTGAWLHST